MRERIKSIVEYIRNSQRARICLIFSALLVFILIVLMIIGARDLEKESAGSKEPGKTAPKTGEENVARRVVKYIERGANKVIIGQPTKIPEKILPTPTPTIPDKKVEIAKNVLSCLNGMRDENGVYALGKKCTTSDSCKITSKDHRVGLNVLWAETKYVEKTNDPLALETLKNDSDLYLDENKVEIISVEFWDKIIFYDMLRSPIFSSADKTKIENLAKRSGRQDNTAALKVQEEIKKPNYQEPNFELLLASPDKVLKNNISEEELRLIAIDAHESLYSYLWKNSQEDLKTAKQLLYNTLEGYLSSNKNLSQENKCFLGLTTARFYNQLKSASFLEAANKIFQEAEIEKSCWLAGACPINVNPPLFCQMFTNELYRATGEKKYLDLKEKILDLLIDNDYDYLGFKGLFTGDGCFYDRGGVKEKLRLTLDNSLMIIALLSE